MLTASSQWTTEFTMTVRGEAVQLRHVVAVRHAALLLHRARAVVRRVRALELLGQSIAGACALALRWFPQQLAQGLWPCAKRARSCRACRGPAGPARGVEGGRR